MIHLIKNINKKDYILLFIIVILVFFQIKLDLSLPDYMSDITMLVQTPNSNINDIYSAAFNMIIFALTSLILSIIVAIISAKIASNFSFITRSKIFTKVMSFSMKEINEFQTSSLITRTTNDIVQVQMFLVMGLQMLIKAPLTAIYAIYKIYSKNIYWTSITFVALILLFIVVIICSSIVLPRFKRMQKLIDNINRITREHLDGINVIRAYNAEHYQNNKFEKANNELTNTNLIAFNTLSFLQPSIQLVGNTLTLGIYIVGAILINDAIGINKIELFSDMVVFSSYAMQILMSFMMLVFVFIMMPRATVAASRINEVLDINNSISIGNIKDITDIGEIEFINVSFKYPNAQDYVLKDISFKVKHNETVALIGSTGSGKSTIINLIPRFYDTTKGQILINGINVKEYNKDTLNKLIGYISQKAILFKGDIKSNIIFGDNNTIINNNNEFDKSIDIAQAKDFINNLEDKHNSYIAQGGKNLSGGQKQRISIARALYRNPNILIFDDSFSALDYNTDKKLRKALNESYKSKTKIIVGQRIGTIKDADKIIVIDDGKIVGQGKHNELLETCDIYKQIALSQLSIEELI